VTAAAELRVLGDDDLEQAWAQNVVAFANDPADKPGWLAGFVPAEAVGAFDGDRLVAKSRARAFRQWWGGRSVPMAGIASVTVAPDQRGRGLARAVVSASLELARQRGDAVAVLYPASVRLYRSLGFEFAGDHGSLRMPPGALRSRGRAAVADIRPATEADLDAIVGAHRVLSRERPGALDRDAARWAWRLRLDQPGAEVYVEESGGAVTALVAYRRDRDDAGQSGALIRVGDVFALDAGGWQRILALVGSSSTVTSTVEVNASVRELEHFVVDPEPTVHDHHSWMLRVVDAPAAVAGRGFPAGVTAQVDLELVDDELPGNAGRWRLEVAGGAGRLERGGEGHVGLRPGGLAALYAGRLDPESLQRLGLLRADRPAAYAGLAAAFAGPAAHCWDYF
jgi:predicted acetyltransferase